MRSIKFNLYHIDAWAEPCAEKDCPHGGDCGGSFDHCGGESVLWTYNDMHPVAEGMEIPDDATDEQVLNMVERIVLTPNSVGKGMIKISPYPDDSGWEVYWSGEFKPIWALQEAPI